MVAGDGWAKWIVRTAFGLYEAFDDKAESFPTQDTGLTEGVRAEQKTHTSCRAVLGEGRDVTSVCLVVFLSRYRCAGE
jgi:hypothetical protein